MEVMKVLVERDLLRYCTSAMWGRPRLPWQGCRAQLQGVRVLLPSSSLHGIWFLQPIPVRRIGWPHAIIHAACRMHRSTWMPSFGCRPSQPIDCFGPLLVPG